MAITGKEIVDLLNQALTDFGEYTYYDKGPYEVLDVDKIVVELLSMSAGDAGKATAKVMQVVAQLQADLKQKLQELHAEITEIESEISKVQHDDNEVLCEEVANFDKKIAAAYGADFVPADCYSTHCLAAIRNKYPASLIEQEVERRLEKQNGAIKRVRNAFRDARESIWTVDAPITFKTLLDDVRTNTEEIMRLAEKKAPRLPKPKKLIK